jgi:hypothetical protein
VKRKLQIVGLILVTVLLFSPVILAKELHPERMLTRGEAVHRIVESFQIRNNYSSFIAKCLINTDECFFVFAAMSDFDGISFNPLKLYPDVYPNYRYYDAINVASILGLVHGYIYEENTPFKPEIVMTRIQALKVVLGAGEILKWKDKFEITPETTSSFIDIDPGDPERWWYARYANYAALNGIIRDESYFRPDEIIRLHELTALIEQALEYKNRLKNDQEAVS